MAARKITSRTARNRKRLRVGDRAVLRQGDKRVLNVVEDRGNLGVGGRRLLSVRLLDPENGVDMVYEIPEVELERVS